MRRGGPSYLSGPAGRAGGRPVGKGRRTRRLARMVFALSLSLHTTTYIIFIALFHSAVGSAYSSMLLFVLRVSTTLGTVAGRRFAGPFISAIKQQ